MEPTFFVQALVYGLCSVGHFTGVPMVFLGLLGEGEEKKLAREVKAGEAASLALDELARGSARCGVEGDEPYPARGAWVTICGPEPASTPLAPLVAALQDLGFYVALVTTGRATGHLGAGVDFVTVTPRPLLVEPNRVDFIDSDVMWTADEVAFVIGDASDVEWALAMCERYRPDPERIRTVSAQPLNERSKPLTASMGLRHGWRVCIFPLEASMPSMRPDVKIAGQKVRRVDAANIVAEVLAARRGDPLSS